MIQPPIPPQGRPFIPDPYYAVPVQQYQPQYPPVFIPTAIQPKSRKTRQPGEPKPRRHIKMMKKGTEWDPVESLRSLPVMGLDYGNLFDWSPGIRIAIGKALQMEKEEGKSKRGGKPANPAFAVQEVALKSELL
ncbi:hypothetical protein L211DRAFT_851840 [Terfezia boudieri ATCC MYA-4762]|uniref:Uncharacterized protein n=1 Tax=Terfezia boudieri ATCC MYA-4762 TaxID=1051890 RepID=A0A3N4LKD0_9PEZI|nr:hypothetical protein L211DRAFT_851840 [Terfezia boudieri ATCC MYA-4762]